ncbi:hypothetical protein JRQ81_016694 [Phrynocephalus forsythii]|uniref:ELMO domain-containing protein n=1 Tax=Phrynocephalus forsythii TaxID=171643 RepID=A0A9Q0XSR0_9SAUR|nr:hypothetical protein JRQ81_016694 [Phrynocephalus forsythii]
MDERPGKLFFDNKDIKDSQKKKEFKEKGKQTLLKEGFMAVVREAMAWELLKGELKEVAKDITNKGTQIERDIEIGREVVDKEIQVEEWKCQGKHVLVQANIEIKEETGTIGIQVGERDDRFAVGKRWHVGIQVKMEREKIGRDLGTQVENHTGRVLFKETGVQAGARDRSVAGKKRCWTGACDSDRWKDNVGLGEGDSGRGGDLAEDRSGSPTPHTCGTSYLYIRDGIHENSLESSKYKVLQNAVHATEDEVEKYVSLIIQEKKINIQKDTGFQPKLQLCLLQISGCRELYLAVEALRKDPYNSDNKEHEEQLMELWNLLMPHEKLKARITKQWCDIGFQGDDPKTDFRGMGMLGLTNLLYFSKHYPREARQILVRSNHPKLG